MGTIDDFGGATDPLNTPPLGGPNGWAAAVRDAINANSNDITQRWKIWTGSQAEYDAIGTYDPATLYVVTS
jgi:hypothetical protein